MSTISTSGISPSQIIRSEHSLRIINALNGTTQNDIIISGSLTISGSASFNDGITGSLLGTSSQAISSSFAATSSVTNAILGTSQFIPKFDGTNTLNNSSIFERDINSIGIGTSTPPTSAILTLESTTTGFLPPRMTNSEMTSIPTPVEGLMVYNLDSKAIFVFHSDVWNQLAFV